MAMKLTVKTLKGSHFQIRVLPSDTIMAVKKNIEDIQGKDNYPCGQQLLIHNGKVLKDETTLAENKVSEDGFLVVMLSKSKSSSGSSCSSTQHGPTTVPTSSARPASEASVQSLVPKNPLPASVAASTNAPSGTYIQAASNLVAGNDTEQTIQQIMDMGGGSWDRETVRRALRAACNNPERAVDYLYSGIPESAEGSVAVPGTTKGLEIGEGAGNGAISTTPVSGAPNSSPLNLFPQAVPAGGGDGDEIGPLDFLRNSQQFQRLRSMVQANPQILQPILQELGKQNPNLLRLVQENNAEFIQLINEPAEGSEGDFNDDSDQEMTHAVSVTPEEQDAVERLEAMGFDRALVIEAFLACDRNEELATNYLLENAGDFED